ncbi:MAG: hypothetical protein GX621_00525 [Pirellulaceae bacterium]|nr:hypothetical protein [Pirellulaceae bacterium]
MNTDQTVIYVAGSAQQAHLLRNLLAEHGIQAAVINEMLERGSGVDYVGWSTLARVVVHRRDAVEARRIAMEHDAKGAQLAQERESDAGTSEAAGTMPDAWPRCPECGEPRITRCPICRTTGIEFREADDEFVWGMGLDEVPEGKPSCGCGHSCGGETTHQAPAEPPPDGDDDDERQLVLMCPTCDEPFLPAFPRQCAWCDHEFPDGYESDEIVQPTPQADSRVAAIIVGLLILLALVVGYFMFVL